MRLQTFCICMLLLSCQARSLAQNIEITRQSTDAAREKSKTFTFIQPQTDTSLFAFVASLKATGAQGTRLDKLYYTLRDKAQKLGANTFRLSGYRPGDSLTSPVLVLDCYYGEDTVLSQNAGNREKNVVYVFASTLKLDKPTSFKIDNRKEELMGGTYLRHTLDKDQEVKISKGFMGATMWLKWKEDRIATFLTLTGLGLADNTPVIPGQVNVGFTTGRISYMDDDLGCLLVLLLEKAPAATSP